MGFEHKARRVSRKALNEFVANEVLNAVVVEDAASANVEKEAMPSKVEIAARSKELKAMAIDDLKKLVDKLIGLFSITKRRSSVSSRLQK